MGDLSNAQTIIQVCSFGFVFLMNYSYYRIRISNRTMNSSQAWYNWCNTHEPTVDPSDPRIESDTCVWHINIHACSLGPTVSYCGPW